MPDLHAHQSPTLDLIGEHYEAKGEADAERTYLGASVLGDACERKLWLQFRWAYHAIPFQGRMIRLFETGHLQEERMIADLRAVGCEIVERTDDGGQIAVRFADGHGGGHLDGEVVGLVEAPKAVHVLECKTHNAKSFAQLKKHGVREAKPQHYDQMQVYMHLRGRERGCYLAVNKDTEELYLERIHYDADAALRLMAKADRIVHAHHAPDRIASDASSFPCRFCDLREACHEAQFARRNCRTCLNATPGANGVWWCGRHGRELSADDQRAGCANHLYLPSLVPGEQVDADQSAETVTYQMPNGETWVDGAQRSETGRAA